MSIAMLKTDIVLPKPALRPRHRLAVGPPVAQPAVAPDHTVHPMAFVVPLASAAWFAILGCVAFARGDGLLPLAVVALIFTMLFGLLAGCGAFSRDGAYSEGHARNGRRSFDAFLKGRGDTYTGTVSGHEAMVQIAMLPATLAIGATLIIGWALLSA